MAGKSNIEWTGHTWNPLAGCTVLTPGCKRCYAMKMAARLEAMGQPLYAGLTEPSKAGPVWTGVMRQAPEHVLLAPLRRKKPTTYFVNSMSDLFHEKVPDEWILKILDVIRRTSWDGGSNCGSIKGEHTYQVLTKRAARMAAFMPRLRFDSTRGLHLSEDGKYPVVLKNLWLGVSTERQQEADERIPLLLQTPAAIRFISAEPLLGPIALHALNLATATPSDALRGVQCVPDDSADGFHNEPMNKLDWVIVGGESGPGYRPMAAEWARGLRDWCIAAGVPVFIKQMAGKKPIPTDLMVRQFPAPAR